MRSKYRFEMSEGPVSPDVNLHIGKQIRARRTQLKLTQAKVASSLGCGFQQIHNYECGITRLSAERLWHLAHALGVPVGYFYEQLDAPSTPTLAECSLRSPPPQFAGGGLKP
ncbi:helix-turn-helix domain-containing protein [Caulobacter sp. S45]|uniref:helix-turn-helix domain-containing protein n=1 Tax=Caulobacter sp. S45 TaxID=1641861 RepID=UPI00352B1D42